MSGNRRTAPFGDVLHFLAFLAAAVVIWHYAITLHWSWLFIVGAMVAWGVLLIGTLGWVKLVYPAVTLLVLHLAFGVAYGLYCLNIANTTRHTDTIVVCKLYTTDENASSHIETRIRTSRKDYTLGAVKFIDATGKVTYFKSGADAATKFSLGGSFHIVHAGGHWGASDVVKQATKLTTSVGTCKR